MSETVEVGAPKLSVDALVVVVEVAVPNSPPLVDIVVPEAVLAVARDGAPLKRPPEDFAGVAVDRVGVPKRGAEGRVEATGREGVLVVVGATKSDAEAVLTGAPGAVVPKAGAVDAAGRVPKEGVVVELVAAPKRDVAEVVEEAVLASGAPKREEAVAVVVGGAWGGSAKADAVVARGPPKRLVG